MGTNGLDPMSQLRERDKCKLVPNKLIYKNSEEAWAKALERSRETHLKIVPYACDGCGWFHLTSSDKVNDKVVPAQVGISTTTLRKKTPVTTATIPIRKDMTPEGPTIPANFDAKVKMAKAYLKGKQSATTEGIKEALGEISKNSLSRVMREIGWYNTRGRNPLWKPESEKKTAIITPIKKKAEVTDIKDAPTTREETKAMEESIARHPAGKDYSKEIVEGTTTSTFIAPQSNVKFFDWRTMDTSKFETMTVAELIKTLEQFNLEVRIQAAFIE